MGCCSSYEAVDLTKYKSIREAISPPPPATNPVDSEFESFGPGEFATFGCGEDFHLSSGYFALFPGVIRIRVGYSGGKHLLDKRNFKKIFDHTEVIDIEFDPEKISYDKLVQHFFATHDPTASHGGFVNPGAADRRLHGGPKKEEEEGKKRHFSIIFYHSKEQKEAAELAIMEHDRNLHKEKVLVLTHIRTDIYPAKYIYPALKEDQHFYLQQDEKLSKLVNCTTSEELQYSHLACKLNGLLSDKATLKDLEDLREELKLDEDTFQYLHDKIKARESK